jgi:hypothetical protein
MKNQLFITPEGVTLNFRKLSFQCSKFVKNPFNEAIGAKLFKANRFAYLRCRVLAVFLLYGFLVRVTISASQARGLFGDMFGGLNALFSALAFAVIAYSIFQHREQLALQRQEMPLQRQELELTRKELAKTAKFNALAILAQTYSDSLTWMKDINNSNSSAIAAVSQLHTEAISETERLCGMSASMYDE